jgi:tetratricopeptide (TPR) repeat protein
MRLSFSGVASMVGLAVAAGCAGRAEFARGRELFALGQYREAYLSYWEAYHLNPSPAHRRELVAAGALVAQREAAEGLEAERRGDLEVALDRLSLALEYAPDDLLLREDFARVWMRIEARDDLLRRWLAAQQQPGPPWAELRLAQELLGEPGQSLAAGPLLRQAFARGAERAAASLRTATFEELLPTSREALAALEAGWQDLELDVARLLAEEELLSAATDPLERELGSLAPWRSMGEGLAEEARAGRRAIETALGGVALFEAGVALEAGGELERAAATYQAALASHPSHEEARERRQRIVAALCEEAWQRARVALRERAWKEAIAAADTLLRHDPQHLAARQLRAVAYEEVCNLHEAAARRAEEAGLHGNALARYLVACQAQPRRQDLREEARRVERTLAARLRPRFRVQVVASDPDSLRLHSALWGVPVEAIVRCLEDFARRLQQELDAAVPPSSSLPRPEERAEQVVWLEDFDFSCMEESVSHGTESARFLAGLEWVQEESREPARVRTEAAASDARRAREEAMAAPIEKRSYCTDRGVLRGQLADQAELLFASLPRLKPAIRWETATFSTRQVHLRLEAAVRYRVAGDSRWVATVEERTDRVVAGDPDRNIPPDAEERVSRGEALRALVEALAAPVAKDLDGHRRERGERSYREAVEQLSQGSLDVGVESLVAFLILRKGADDALSRDANRRLRTVTGCDLLLAWQEE